MHKRLLSGITSAPLAAVLAIPSVAITVFIALTTVIDGRVSSDAPVGLICAVLIAGVAATEASRPARSSRTRKGFPAPDESDERY
jgi:hypothetical protein